MGHSEFRQLYSQMFEAVQKGDVPLADEFRKRLEDLRNQFFEKPETGAIEILLKDLPPFASQVMSKNHLELGISEKSNCINAAFNFHDSKTHWPAYSTMDFLDRIRSDFIQINTNDEAKWGDLVVLWSRTGGTWDMRTINVHEMNQDDRDFPYGLVFDHVAVRLSENLVFHKPDPTLESRYQIDFLDSLVGTTASNQGFELTYHRVACR